MALINLMKSRYFILKLRLFLVPLLFSISLSILFYPGFMSYDTLHALRGARNGVYDSIWPPMVSYIWRCVDFVSTNPSAMHFAQVFILITAIFYIVFICTRKIRFSIIFLVIYLSLPVVLGAIAVIWKDVLMAGLFLFGFLLSISLEATKKSKRRFLICFFALFFIFLGVCVRHNAIAGAVPLIFYLTWVMGPNKIQSRYISMAVLILGGILITNLMYFSKTIFFDNYSVPSLTRMVNQNHIFIESVRILDVAGASLCSGENLFDNLGPNLTLKEINEKYDPRHVNLSNSLLDTIGVDARINEVWLNVAMQHPFCFWNHKIQMAKYMLGLNYGKQFLITAASIDENEYGYALHPSLVRDVVVKYIHHGSRLPFFRPWFLYLLSIFAFIYLAKLRKITPATLALFVSAIFYFAGLFFFGNAADSRLLFYTTTALTMFLFISIVEFREHR